MCFGDEKKHATEAKIGDEALDESEATYKWEGEVSVVDIWSFFFRFYSPELASWLASKLEEAKVFFRDENVVRR